jgi:hypothetical protein
MYKLEVAKIEQWLFLLEYQFQNLDFVDVLKKEIDNKVGILDYKTNVKGKMTKFDEFIHNQIFNNLLKECLYFSNVLNIKDSKLTSAWGNILKRVDLEHIFQNLIKQLKKKLAKLYFLVDHQCMRYYLIR